MYVRTIKQSINLTRDLRLQPRKLLHAVFITITVTVGAVHPLHASVSWHAYARICVVLAVSSPESAICMRHKLDHSKNNSNRNSSEKQNEKRNERHQLRPPSFVRRIFIPPNNADRGVLGANNDARSRGRHLRRCRRTCTWSRDSREQIKIKIKAPLLLVSAMKSGKMRQVCSRGLCLSHFPLFHGGYVYCPQR